MRNQDWVIPALVLVAVQYILAIVMSWQLRFAAPNPAFGYSALGFGVSAAIALVWVVITLGRYAYRGVSNPVEEMTATLRRNAPNIIYGQIGIQLVGLQFGALAWLKAMLPVAIPFWADPLLANIDRAIFGTNPRDLLYPLLEPFTAAISYGYALWFLVNSGLLIAVLFSPAGRRKSQIMLSYFIILGVFGVVGQYAVSSAGPIFWQRIGLGRFDVIPFDPLVQRTADYLWLNYVHAGTGLGGGISAMPSMHVAIAAWIALTLTHLFKPLAILGWTFFAFICIASVFLGWHYAVDGIVGTAAAAVGWKLPAAYLSRRYTIEEKLAGAPLGWSQREREGCPARSSTGRSTAPLGLVERTASPSDGTETNRDLASARGSARGGQKV